MRTTLDLPEDIHELARQLAHQQRKTLSEVVCELIRAGLEPRPPTGGIATGGLPQITVGRVITAEDVRSLEDEE